MYFHMPHVHFKFTPCFGPYLGFSGCFYFLGFVFCFISSYYQMVLSFMHQINFCVVHLPMYTYSTSGLPPRDAFLTGDSMHEGNAYASEN